MGHKISKEQIDPGVKDHIMSFVGDVADLETEVNTDIISAVNSLMVDRVDNAENMGKLANAIGEPVTANHSVDEVVEGLGEMLSTFKTNMMNSGVVVESSDKFKQLIDKIKGLTEGEGNKGIQYAEGTITVDSPFVITSSNPYTVSTNLDFTPSLVVVSFKSICSCSNITIDSVTATPNNKLYLNLGLQTYDYFYSSYLWLSDVTAESFKIYGSTTYSYSIGSGDPTLIQSSPFTWYAIGVGEEDTTLRDSLASILTEEGVDVTEEDDMASLITKVDEEFDEKNNISKVTQVVASDNELFRIYNPSPGKTTYTYQYTSICEIVCTFEGSIRVCFDAYISQGSCSVYCELYRGETIVDTEIFTIDQTAFNSASKKTYDFLDVKCGDIIRLDSNIGTTVSCYIRNIILKGDIIL